MILDLAVANQIDCTVSILLGVGDGTFQKIGDYGEEEMPYFYVCSDRGF